MLVKMMAGIYINTDEIRYIIPYSSTSSKALYKKVKSEGKSLDLTKHRAVKSIISLKDGTYIFSPLLADTMVRKFNDTKE